MSGGVIEPGPLRLAYFYDLPLPAPLAAPIQILKTCAALADRGVDVEVHCGRLRCSPEECLAEYGVAPRERLRLTPSLAMPRRVWVRRTLHHVAERVDVVMSRGEAGAWVRSMLGANGTRAAFVYESHRPLAPEHWRKYGAGGAAAAEQFAVEGAEAVVCISRGVASDLHARFRPRGRMAVLPSGVDDPPEEATAGERDIDMLYAGKLEARKGLGLALRALRLLTGARLVVAGGNAAAVRAVRQEAQRLGVAERTELLGYVAPAHIRRLFLRTKVALCPLPAGVSEVSERFTSPMKLLEAMACAAPVATDLPSVRELVGGGRDGMLPARLVRPNDAEAMADACRELLEDAEMRERLAACARRRVRRFTWAERARGLHEVLTEVLRNRRRESMEMTGSDAR